jgi:hypothetical protein
MVSLVPIVFQCQPLSLLAMAAPCGDTVRSIRGIGCCALLSVVLPKPSMSSSVTPERFLLGADRLALGCQALRHLLDRVGTILRGEEGNRQLEWP